MNTVCPLRWAVAWREIESMRSVRLFSSLVSVVAAACLVACSSPKPAPQATPAGVWPPADSAATTTTTTTRPGPVRDSAGYTWSPQMGDTSQRLRGALSGSGIDVSQTTDQRLWLSLPVEAVFPKGRSAVAPGGAANLDKVAQALRANTRAQVQIVGDADPGASGAALALDRAASARDWIVGRGVPASRIVVANRSTRPGVAADARRLDILIGERATVLR
jgi:outer membrane protein OmpA-like peptidoglycan-associated protein